MICPGSNACPPVKVCSNPGRSTASLFKRLSRIDRISHADQRSRRQQSGATFEQESAVRRPGQSHRNRCREINPRKTDMSYNKPIRRIAVDGTGVIGASWAAEYLARGFDVVATDPAPDAESNLRK